MTSTLPQSGTFKEFTEEVKELSSQFFKARESCATESLRLLHTNQRFLKKLEDLKNTKKELNSRRNNYVDQTTVFALRDAELRYQKACMLDTEKEWAAMIANRHEEIKSFRAELESHLQHYCDERRKTATVQTKVTNRTEEDRINSLNSVAFCTYAQTMVDGEVKKLCAAAGLPTTSNIQRMQRIANQAIRASQQDLQDFYAEKIKEFKRQERILYGRGRDAVDTSPRSLLRADNESNTTGNNTSNAYSSTAAGNGSSSSDITADMLVDTLENRIATKLVSSTLESLRNTDDEGGNEGSNRFMRTSNFNPAPPLSSPSGKMASSSNYPNSATSGRRNITSSGKPSKGGEEASSPLRASTLQQHQQRMLSLQQQHPQRGAALANQGIESRGNRRFSLLQNGDLIPAVSVSITDEVTKSGKARGPQANVPALASATVGNQLAGTNNKTGPANSAMAATISNAKTANMSSHATSKQKKKHKRRKSTDGEGDNVVFDPNRYIPACSVDFVKPHTLLDLTSPTIADREEKLLTLANLSCEARGRVTQMTFLRDALDGLLMRQIACLLTALTHNQPMPLPLSSPGGQMLLHATQQPAQALIDQHLLVPRSASVDEDPAAVLLRNPEDALAAAAAVLDGSANLPLVNDDDDDDASATAFHQYAADPGKKKALTQFKKQPLRLSAAHKIIQLDCAQKEQDIHILRDRIALLLQRPPDSPPTTARRPKGNLANNQPESL